NGFLFDRGGPRSPVDTCITAFRTISTFSSMTTIAFGIWAKEVIEALQADVNQSVKVLRQEERFARLMVTVGDLPLRIEMVNDVPAHIGEIITHNVLGRLDSAENILANKVTAAIDRNEPKDLADIWGLCCKMSPDSRSIGFFAGSKLKRLDIGAGPPQVLADAPAGRGGAWNSEGTILFAQTTTSPLWRVPASGGSPVQVTKLDLPRQGSHRFPQFLP